MPAVVRTFLMSHRSHARPELGGGQRRGIIASCRYTAARRSAVYTSQLNLMPRSVDKDEDAIHRDVEVSGSFDALSSTALVKLFLQVLPVLLQLPAYRLSTTLNRAG